MAAGVGHTGGLTKPRPWRGRCRAGYSNTGGPPLPRKRAPSSKKHYSKYTRVIFTLTLFLNLDSSFFLKKYVLSTAKQRYFK